MSSEGQEEEDSGDKYQKLLDSWDDLLDEDEEEEQDETNVHKRAVQPILNEFLRPYVNEYIRSYNNVQKREEIKARINGIMNDFKDRVDNQDLDDFSRLV